MSREPAVQLSALTQVVDRRCGGSPLERLSEAITVGDELVSLRDELLDRFVGEARAAGHSWAEIGERLGMSRQGAHQRFVEPSPFGPLRHFTDAGRAAVVAAQDEARRLRHHYIGTEHLLLGLLAEPEGTAARALASLGVSLTATRQKVEGFVGRGEDGGAGAALRMVPRAKKVLELARRSAHELGQDLAGPEHLLLGLLSEGRGVAVQVLRQSGADDDQVVEALSAALGTQVAPPGRHQRGRSRMTKRRRD